MISPHFVIPNLDKDPSVWQDKYMPDTWKCIAPPTQSFAGLPVCTQLDDLDAEIAIIGLHYVSPYPQKLAAAITKSSVETAKDAIRRQSSIFIGHLDHYNFDFNDVF